MNLNKVANAICRGLWLLEPRTANALLPIAVKFMKGEPVEFFDQNESEPPFLFSQTKGAFSFFDDDADSDLLIEQNSVLIIPVNGTIMKDDYCGEPGTDTLSQWFQAAMQNPNILGVVLKINSGGGSVQGTGEFADAIKNAIKPVVTWCDGIMASAAYWIGSSAIEVFASHATTEYGSIGTAINFYDFRKMMEKDGVSEIYINADSSPDKNQDYFNALDGDTSSIKNNILNPTNEIFMEAVKDNRAGKLKVINKIKEGSGISLNEPLTGKMYLAKTAIENGLIDKIGSLEDAVMRVVELSEIEIAA